MSYPSQALISRSAYLHNLARMQELTEVMPILKADAYGHGLERIARWSLEGGSGYFGVAQLAEALQARAVCPQGRILSWIYTPQTDLEPALQADIEISVGAPWAISSVANAVARSGKTAKIHIKVDTGMARGGFSLSELPAMSARIRELVAAGKVEVVGLWSHLSSADEEGPQTESQIACFEQARKIVAAAEIAVQIHHLAASAAALWHPKARYDMSRIGICLYGLSPNPQRVTAEQLDLRPVMTVQSQLLVARRVPAGTGVSYNHTYHTTTDTELGVVALGYADGVPRLASNRAHVVIAGKKAPVRGRICMDQFIVEGSDLSAGDTATLFGAGAPSADDWAQWSQSISYEVLTGIGARVERVEVE